VARFLIQRDTSSSTFFDGVGRGQLLIQRCGACGHHQFALTGRAPGVGRCRRCSAPDPEWVPSAGTGSVATFTVIPGPPTTDGPPPTASVAVIVELDEGPWITAPLEGLPDEVMVGTRVAVAFREPDGDGESLPVFRVVA
jgi:uncharacterized protein